MSISTHRRLVNPMLGVYFGIFASSLVALAVMLLIMEQLGATDRVLRISMLAVPLAFFIFIGVATASQDTSDFLAAGRRVPAAYTGLAMACSAIGGTGLIAGTGLFFINGFDAWCLPIGLWSGFVVMALLIAPFLRKFGAYTVASYLGRRFDNRLLRILAAAVFVVPMLLIGIAELKMGAFAAAWLVGLPERLALQIIVLALVPMVVFGGMRSLTWTNAAQAIALMLALILPVSIVAAFETNLPFPQLSHGPVLRSIGRLEAMQGVPMPIAAPLAMDLAGLELTALGHRMAQPYASVGPLAFILLIACLICGVASAPWLLPRASATPSVYETRKSAGWAIVFCGFVALTMAAVAVFLRDIFMDQVIGRHPANLPQWLRDLANLGFISTTFVNDTLAVTGIAVRRDATLFALPIAAGYSPVVVYMALAGGLAAAMLGASAVLTAMANTVAEDGLGGLVWNPTPRLRLASTRVAITAAILITGWVAMLVPADPLDLMLWGLAISASSAFPVLVLSVLWKRLNAFGAGVAIIAGFTTSVLAILAGEAAWLGVPGTLAATFGVPAGFLAAAIATRLAGVPDKHVLALVRDMRLPGGETIYDRDVRRSRMKEQRSA